MQEHKKNYIDVPRGTRKGIKKPWYTLYKRNFMLKQVTQFKSVINNIESLFHFDSGAPISVAKEALFECLKWIGQIEDQARANAAAQAQETPQTESPPIDNNSTPAKEENT